MQVTDLKIYLGALEQAQYKMIVKVFSKDRLIFFETYEEHYFS